MKKFKFPLKKMRDYKEQLLENEKGTLMKLIADRDEAYARMNELKASFNMLNNELGEKIKVGIAVMQIKIYEYRKDNIRSDQEQTQIRINIIEGAIERQRRVVVLLNQEISGLNKLEEKQRAEYDAAVMKENENMISEFIVQKLAGEAT
ncbi:MAG: hypothetical protein LBR54_02310 [Oscillospiraceae bacterium]|jgi:flagellar export protein FliJ|nr:hypothetical protein [Oscillospiraceae bacterium]